MQATPESQSAAWPASVTDLSLLRRFAAAALLLRMTPLAPLRRLGCGDFQARLAARPMAGDAMAAFWRSAAGAWGRR